MYFKYIIDETFISLKKSPMMLFCAVVIITTSLALLGVFIMGDKFFKAIVSNFENNLEIVAFLEDGFNESTVKNVIIPSISTYQGVSSVRLVTKEGAREELKKEVPELNEVFSVIEENPLPASIRVKVTSADSLAEITAKLKKENGIAVSEVTYGGESVNSFLNAAKSLKQFMVL
ncbi:MAG TPA: permease-like cell division protein FtsX, partial [Candidatus Wallbacteria bacterium]|nr:permease-like cell division protein FtsX [Candidatus Wallbacteria bacterium]